MNDQEPEHFRIPEDLDRRDREQWWTLKRRRTAILRKIMVLMGKQMYGASLKSLSPKCLEELAIEAEELADCWEDASIEDVPPQAKTKLQWLLANYCEIREEMIDIVDAAIERARKWKEFSMRVRILVPAVLFTAMLSAPVLGAINHAASHPSHRSSEPSGSSNLRMDDAATNVQCSILQQQLDEVVMTHQTVGESNDGKTWPTTRNVCVNGDPAEGVVKLRQALRNWGVKPNA
jgi:hypothetical protein